MIDHGHALTLAATSIDFPLGAAERGILDAHVGACPACRTALAEFRRDAARLAALPPIAPPSWVRGALGKRPRSNPFVLLAAAAFLITAAGLAFVVGTTLLDDRTAVVVPTLQPLASASVVVTPPPSSAPTLRPSLIATSALSWGPLAATGGGSGSITGGLSVQGAYIVFGTDDIGLAWVARSTDGQQWDTTQLGVMVQPCANDDPRPDSSIYVAATNGVAVVLAGIEYAMGVSPCGGEHAVTWVSADGRTWQRSTGFGAVGGFAEAHQVWAIPGGWEALVTNATGGPTKVWRSLDGLHWRWVSELDPGVSSSISTNIAAAADGTRLMALYNGEIGETIEGLVGGESSLRTSTGGLQWNALGLTLPLGRGVSAFGIVPPGPIGPNVWMLVTVADAEPPIAWTSSDLQEWAQGTFPRDELASIASTRFGYIATGNTLCGVGGSCSLDAAQYFSTNGLDWAAFPASVGETLVVDGPAGVLALAGPDFRVWQLRP